VIKILLADKQELAVEGLKAIINQDDEFELVAPISKDKAQLFENLIEYQPDLLVIDYDFETLISVEELEEVKSLSPLTKTLIVSSDKNKRNILKVLNTNVESYVTKECPKYEIIDAIHATAKGQKFFCNKILDTILKGKTTKYENSCDPSVLSDREVEIIKLIAEGCSSLEIADKLFLSHHTINTHRKNILKKVNLKTPTELVVYAINSGLVEL